ncbi:ketopantoate reductase-like protein [Mycena vulgaris]|nr:ketopantoate reductase-like protein [Mycena vulgaris]
MRFHVLGLGPLGSFVAHHLRRTIPPAHSVALLYNLRQGFRDVPTTFAVETAGARTTSSGFAHESMDFRYGAPTTLYSIRKIAPRLSAESTIVLLQNGLGVYEQLIQNVFRNPRERPHFIFASSTHAAFYPSATALYSHRRNTLLNPTIGNIDFAIVPDPLGRNFEAGFLDEAVHPSERRPRLSDLANPQGDQLFRRYRSLRNTVAAFLLAEPLNASWRSMAHVQLALRRRLVVNAVVHPLTAIMGCRNGEVFNSSAAVRVATRICQEASDIYSAQICDETTAWLAASHSETGGALGIARLPHALEAEVLVRECMAYSRKSNAAISHMLSDIRRGRRTEIDYLNGYLVSLGKTYKVETPANATVYHLLRMRSSISVDHLL